MPHPMPHSGTCGGHFRHVDWEYLGLVVGSLGEQLAGESPCMDNVAKIAHRAAGLGGTEFLLKTPLIDAVLARVMHVACHCRPTLWIGRLLVQEPAAHCLSCAHGIAQGAWISENWLTKMRTRQMEKTFVRSC